MIKAAVGVLYLGLIFLNTSGNNPSSAAPTALLAVVKNHPEVAPKVDINAPKAMKFPPQFAPVALFIISASGASDLARVA
ncbi:hypothetical protein SDC9_177489 [bioreactor metagenome]|uniref:Uncharacterized protein n=1 Tax=bioreactor metagenome TaxID=1076179 RepID=A0A645GVI3_9ZZZZ